MCTQAKRRRCPRHYHQNHLEQRDDLGCLIFRGNRPRRRGTRQHVIHQPCIIDMLACILREPCIAGLRRSRRWRSAGKHSICATTARIISKLKTPLTSFVMCHVVVQKLECITLSSPSSIKNYPSAADNRTSTCITTAPSPKAFSPPWSSTLHLRSWSPRITAFYHSRKQATSCYFALQCSPWTKRYFEPHPASHHPDVLCNVS